MPQGTNRPTKEFSTMQRIRSAVQRRVSLGGGSAPRGFVLAVSLVAGTLMAGFSSPALAAAKPAAKPTAKTSSHTTVKGPTRVPAPVITDANPCPSVKSTRVAVMKNTKIGATVKIYENPDDSKPPSHTLAIGVESNNTLVFSVIGDQPGWLNTNIPLRPNGLTGWIKNNPDEIKTYNTPFYVLIQLKRFRLTVCNAGRIIQQEPAGIGLEANGLTPTGTFYLLDLIRPKGGPNGAYGPFAFGLSGFSESIFNFNGGDGRLGIHGTSDPSSLGRAKSHGCIRVSNAGITKMAKTLFLGSPVRITLD
jgi:lipoprotein-anchoring transpeptidase ErfK/SrfK